MLKQLKMGPSDLLTLLSINFAFDLGTTLYYLLSLSVFDFQPPIISDRFNGTLPSD